MIIFRGGRNREWWAPIRVNMIVNSMGMIQTRALSTCQLQTQSHRLSHDRVSRISVGQGFTFNKLDGVKSHDTDTYHCLIYSNHYPRVILEDCHWLS